MGRSHAVYRVRVGGTPRFYLKVFGPNRGASDGLPEREESVLRLAAERPEVAALVPGGWPWAGDADDEAGRVVATAAVAGAEAWTFDRPGGGTEGLDEAWRALVGALVPPLAAFHRATRDLARPGVQVPAGLQPVLPWVLCLMDGDAAPELWAARGTADTLRKAAEDPQLVAGLRAARALWRPMALIHADLKHDNVLVESTAVPQRVRVVDWEMARVGDPAWDLAAITARLLVARGDGASWSAEDLDAATRLLSAYAAATGLAVPALARRLVLYSGALLLMMALQHASMLLSGSDPAATQLLVDRARATMARADRLTTDLIDRSGAVPAVVVAAQTGRR